MTVTQKPLLRSVQASASAAQGGGYADAAEAAPQQEMPATAGGCGIPATQAQEIAEDRVDGLFHLSNMDHPAQVALRQLCISRLAKKLSDGA